MADELIDIYDENNTRILEQTMKSDAHKSGLWHRVIQVWIYNSKGEILLQLRNNDKTICPNMWDTSVAGHTSAGEDVINSALRETKEELGLVREKEDLEFLAIKKVKDAYMEIGNNEFYYIYLLKFDGNIRELKIQEEELSAIRFLPIYQIEQELNKVPNQFVPHGDYWQEIIGEVRRRINFS